MATLTDDSQTAQLAAIDRELVAARMTALAARLHWATCGPSQAARAAEAVGVAQAKLDALLERRFTVQSEPAG